MAKHTITVDQEQVPVPATNEAFKDVEARMIKLCAWLDEKRCTDIDFYIDMECPADAYVEFTYEDKNHEVVGGTYIVFMQGGTMFTSAVSGVSE